MAKDFDTMEDSNRSSNPSIHEVSDPSRRRVLHGGLAVLSSALLANLSGCATARGEGAVDEAAGPRLGFKSVSASLEDAIRVPEGYTLKPAPGTR